MEDNHWRDRLRSRDLQPDLVENVDEPIDAGVDYANFGNDPSPVTFRINGGGPRRLISTPVQKWFRRTYNKRRRTAPWAFAARVGPIVDSPPIDSPPRFQPRSPPKAPRVRPTVRQALYFQPLTKRRRLAFEDDASLAAMNDLNGGVGGRKLRTVLEQRRQAAEAQAALPPMLPDIALNIVQAEVAVGVQDELDGIMDLNAHNWNAIGIMNSNVRSEDANILTDDSNVHNENTNVLTDDSNVHNGNANGMMDSNAQKENAIGIMDTNAQNGNAIGIIDTNAQNGNAIGFIDTNAQNGNAIGIIDTNAQNGSASGLIDVSVQNGNAIGMLDSNAHNEHTIGIMVSNAQNGNASGLLDSNIHNDNANGIIGNARNGDSNIVAAEADSSDPIVAENNQDEGVSDRHPPIMYLDPISGRVLKPYDPDHVDLSAMLERVTIMHDLCERNVYHFIAKMASVSYHIANLLEKMQSTDKDFRFMATNDLMSELQKDSIKLDDDSERKVVKMLLRLLEDKNGEVQNLAVKCLGPLVNKVKEFQVETIVDSLCNNMISDKEQLRDISSIGLKTVIAELPQAPGGLSSNICKKITKRLTTAIEREDVAVQLEALEIICDLLYRFGPVLSASHGPILTALLPLLASQRQAVRKRTISALSNLVLSCSNALYAKLLDYLREGLSGKTPGLQTHTYIQCVAAVCRQSGHRFGEQIQHFIPLIMHFITVDDDELREYCLQAFEAFVRRCPNETTEHVAEITTLCVTFVKHDPNYNYDEDDDEEGDGENGSGRRRNANDADEEDDEDDNDEYSDDDDMSWKVRRSAAKCLECIIVSRHEMLADFYQNLSPVLIQRFREREENVKSDIFHAYISLLRQTRSSAAAAVVSVDPDSMEQDTPAYMLQQQVPFIVRALQAQMREKSIKTRQDCFYLLKELCNVIPGALTHEIGALIPGIQYSLGDKNSTNMRIDALNFIHCLVLSHAPTVFHPYIPVLLPAVITAVGDNFYKITAEALSVLQELVRVIRPLPGSLDHLGRLIPSSTMVYATSIGQHNTPVESSPDDFDFAPYVTDIYQCVLNRLRTHDIDQEVKERAICTMSHVICTMGDHLRDVLEFCMPIFIERMRNEITRLTTVKAFVKIVSSPLNIPMKVLNEAIPMLAAFLRKNHRALKLSTLILLDAMIQIYYKHLNWGLLQYVAIELPYLLDDSDLHIAQYGLTVTRHVGERFPDAISANSNTLVPKIMVLVKSPLLQGTALTSMLELFSVMPRLGVNGMNYHQMLPLLTTPVRTEEAMHKQAYYSIAKCVAALTMTDVKNALTVVNQFVRDMPAPKTDSQHLFGLLVIGEVGRKIDLQSVKNLEKDIIKSFSNISEEVKSAASYALGSIAIGNLDVYLPFILQEIANQPKRQYLLLHSLKEVISCLSDDERLHPFISEIWQQLFKHAESPEEGTRNVVAECLGKLTLIKPYELLPCLQEHLNSPSPLLRTTCVTAVKFTISDQPSEIDPLLRQCIGQFLNTIQDPDLNVRRVALVAFNSAAHNKPSLIRDLLDGILPQLYSETVVKRDLIREVEMGPFTHTVDDGLDLRKAAFECMYTLLDSCVDRIDIFEFLLHVESGLKDHYDIKMLTYLMVARLSQICPGAVLQRLDRLVEPLRTTCTTKVKANSVKQEYEKQDELKRSAMRAVIALLTIPDSDKNPQLSEFMNCIRNSTDLQSVFEAIQRDSAANNHDTYLMDQS